MIWLALGGVLLVAGLGINAVAASAAIEFKFEGEIGHSGMGGSEFVRANAVAVDDANGMLYVLDSEANALYKFDLKGNPVNFSGSSPNLVGNELSGLSVDEADANNRQVAVNSTTHEIYLTGQAENGAAHVIQAFHADGDPALFSATGTNELAGSPGFSSVKGVAIDQNGAIYTSDGAQFGNGIQVYDKSGAVVYSSAGAGDSLAAAGSVGFKNIAVNSAGALYAVHLQRIDKYLPSEYPVTSATTYSTAGVVDPNEATGVAVDRQTDNVYVAESAPTPRVALFDRDGASLATFAQAGEEGALKEPQDIAASSDIEGRAFAFVPDSPAGGPSRVKIFAEKICLCPPKVTATSVSAVTGDSATLHARIDPGNLDTAYRFEYGLVDCASGPCQEAPLGGGSIAARKNEVKVSVALSGLQAETTYYFRAVAENSEGTDASASKTFTTQSFDLGRTLLDGRAWEMVSPPKKFGGVIISTGGTLIQASSSGEKLAYASAGSIFENPSSNRPPEPTSILSERDPEGLGIWRSRDLAPTHKEATTAVQGETEFKLFAPDLAEAVMEPNSDLPLSTLHNAYLWSDGNPPSLAPLIDPGELTSNLEVTGASSDLAQIALRSEGAPLVPGAAKGAVYLWSGGAIEAVSELPQGEGGAVVKGSIGTGEGSVRHAISDDGSRVFWSSLGLGKEGLYLRDRSAGESTRLDVEQAGAGGGEKQPAFAGASADGSVAYFTDTQRLTPGASPGGRDLYRCEVGPVEGGALGCTELTDISPPLAGSGESAEVIDQLPALSEAGTRLFFVARGVLDEELNEEGEGAEAGEPNLYFWEEGQAPRFVATLSKDDHLVWGALQVNGLAVNISAAISPDGRYFTFTSEKSLTGYENTNAEGQPTTEVFLYDIEAEEGERLSCISCNPTGAIAVGERLPLEEAFFPPDPGGIWAGRWVAATLPQATETRFTGSSLYRPRTALDNGRVFFNSVDGLVAGDSNGEWDVYQYEPVGVGSCAATTNTATATRSGAGCVALISSGSAEGDSGFMDAGESGEDAFFLTRSRLSVLDKDEEMDVYDARVNGIPAVVKPVSECAGEACQPSVGPPNIPTPSSESFQGAETPLNCLKGQRKARRNGKDVCIKKKHRKHKKHHKKHPHKSGGAGR